jgi:hypothetical protein
MIKTSTRKTGRAAKAARTSVKIKKSAKLPRVLAKKAAKALRQSAVTRASARPRSSSRDHMIHTISPPMQPIAPQSIVLRSHKYQVGEIVYYTSPSFGRAAATGSYTVVKLLPSEGDDYQYRIKNTEEAFERVAKESQLDRD